MLGRSVGGQLAKAGCQPAPDSDLACHSCGDCQFFINANVHWSPVILELQHKSVHTVNLTPNLRQKASITCVACILCCSAVLLSYFGMSAQLQYPGRNCTASYSEKAEARTLKEER